MDYLDRNYHALIEFLRYTNKRFENVCLPLKPNSSFDVIVFCSTDSRKLSSIKIICTSTKNESGSYVANLLIGGAHADGKEVKKIFDPNRCHYLFVWTPKSKYLIPTTVITQTKAITMSQFNDYKITIPS